MVQSYQSSQKYFTGQKISPVWEREETKRGLPNPYAYLHTHSTTHQQEGQGEQGVNPPCLDVPQHTLNRSHSDPNFYSAVGAFIACFSPLHLFSSTRSQLVGANGTTVCVRGEWLYSEVRLAPLCPVSFYD